MVSYYVSVSLSCVMKLSNCITVSGSSGTNYGFKLSLRGTYWTGVELLYSFDGVNGILLFHDCVRCAIMVPNYLLVVLNLNGIVSNLVTVVLDV